MYLKGSIEIGEMASSSEGLKTLQTAQARFPALMSKVGRQCIETLTYTILLTTFKIHTDNISMLIQLINSINVEIFLK